MRRLMMTPAFAVAIVVSPVALAQQDTGTEARQAQPAPQSDVVRRLQEDSELRSDWIEGTMVTTPEGEAIGTINDLLIDAESGEITGAVVSVGGFLGIGAKSMAVAWEELDLRYDASEIVLALSKEEAEAAPEFAIRGQGEPPPPER